MIQKLKTGEWKAWKKEEKKYGKIVLKEIKKKRKKEGRKKV